MNKNRLLVAGLACFSTVLPVSCAQPLDLCAEQTGACLTVQVTTDSEGPVDLLRALYKVDTAEVKERDFAGAPGGAVLPLGFQLALPGSGAVNLDIIAEQGLRPTLYGSTQVTLAAGEHQQVTVPLTPAVSNLPYVGPPPRHHAGMVYFPPHQSIVLFGGVGRDGTLLDDTWELGLQSGAWTARSAATPGPAARMATLAYDQSRQLVIVAGGTGVGGQAVQDLWSYDAAGAWTQAVGNRGGGPRTGAGLTVSDNGIAVVYGGVNATGGLLTDLVTYDPENRLANPDFVAHGGIVKMAPIKSPKLVSTTVPTPGVYLLGVDTEASPGAGVGVWQVVGSLAVAGSIVAISPVAAGDLNAPSRRTDFSVVADGASGLIYLFGGIAEPSGAYLQDAYVFSLSNKQWTKVTAPINPTARAGAQLALLPPSVLIFGGVAAPGSPTPVALDSFALMTDPFAAPTVTGAFARRP